MTIINNILEDEDHIYLKSLTSLSSTEKPKWQGE